MTKILVFHEIDYYIVTGILESECGIVIFTKIIL